jgi:hypothetical protein
MDVQLPPDGPALSRWAGRPDAHPLRVPRSRLVAPIRLLAVVLAALAAAPLATGGKIAGARVRWLQNGLLTHPGDKGTWTMSGSIVDKGTFERVGDKCGGASADLRDTHRGTKGTFALRAHIAPPKPDRWTLLSGRGGYTRLHGSGLCREVDRQRGLLP